MIRLEQKKNGFDVFKDDRYIGKVGLYNNPFHMQNQYLDLDDFQLDLDMSKEFFKKLYAMIGRPLQIMTFSDNQRLIDYIVAGGFQCMRKCYEVEGTLEDFDSSSYWLEILHTAKGEREYDFCCRILYDKYTETHRKINPLTAGYAEFVSCLPEDVFYQKDGNLIMHFAFVEENEIAYVYSEDDRSFSSFAKHLICDFFGEFQTVCFEADNCDSTAMVLKTLFQDDENVSFDTYIYGMKK